MSMQPFPDPLGVLLVMKRPEKPSVQEKRHLSYATRLRDDGITFKVAHEAERIGVGKLVRQTIPGSESATISSDEAVLAAAHDGHVIAGVVAGLTDHQTVRMMVIRAVAVDENWRGQGVGLVMLNMIPQMLQMYGVPAPVIACGGCDPASADFYAKAGYTVLKPGEPLVIPPTLFPKGKLADGALFKNPNQQFASWFAGIFA